MYLFGLEFCLNTCPGVGNHFLAFWLRSCIFVIKMTPLKIHSIFFLLWPEVNRNPVYQNGEPWVCRERETTGCQELGQTRDPVSLSVSKPASQAWPRLQTLYSRPSVFVASIHYFPWFSSGCYAPVVFIIKHIYPLFHSVFPRWQLFKEFLICC